MNEHFALNVKKYISTHYFGSVHVYDEVSSTMDKAREYALDRAYDKNVFIALSQTDGRGTNDRGFVSEKGGIYLSILFNDGMPGNDLLTLRIAVGMMDAVNEICGIGAKIKWVNDVYAEGKKICGILTKSAYMDSENSFTVIGIGLNVNQENIFHVPGAASLRMLTGEAYCLEKAVGTILDNIGKRLYETDLSEIISLYRENCISIGKKIKFFYDGSVREGKVMNVNDSGGLTVFFDGKTAEIRSRNEVLEFK
ncbi:MAG: biotin--[Eubacteriaceae bacterium]|nr:biotin--[acetyl-CoA-carboxylase] ligase [Eubacteriaceae bacterium]